MINRCRIDCRNLYTFNMADYGKRITDLGGADAAPWAPVGPDTLRLSSPIPPRPHKTWRPAVSIGLERSYQGWSRTAREMFCDTIGI
jgi:hypothetical protein